MKAREAMLRVVIGAALMLADNGLSPASPAAGRNAPPRLLAQAQPGVPAVPPGLRRLAGRPEGFTAEIEAFLRKLVATYQKAESYRDRGRMKVVQQSGRVITTVETPMELDFHRPNLLRLDTGQHVLACDGTNLYLVMPESQQFTLRRAPARLEKRHLATGSVLGGTEEGHPELIDLLLQHDAYERLVAQITRVSWKPDASVEGVSCRVLAYETAQGTTLINYIDPQRMVLLKIEAETPANDSGVMTPGSRVAVPPQPATRLLYEIGPVTLNSNLPPGVFAYTPARGFRRVNQIGAMGGEEPPGGTGPPIVEGSHLVGRPAPPIALKDLAGQSCTSAELRGKVVLLFFWSINCGEHCLASISKVQAIADHFKDRANVLVLGITNDSDKPQVVAQLLERKQARYRTLLDEEMRLQIQFQLGGQPTFLVLGPDGIVRWAKLGAPPTIQADLIGQMEQLLGAAR